MRQEKGQDIAGACGQLALVNPGSAQKTGGEGIDIEDAAGNRSSKKGKQAVRGKKADRGEDAERTESDSSAHSARGWMPTLFEGNRCKLLCFANIVAVPVLVAMWLAK